MKKITISLIIYSLLVSPVLAVETFMADTEDIKSFDKILRAQFKNRVKQANKDKDNEQKSDEEDVALLDQLLNDETVKETVFNELSEEINDLKESVRSYLQNLQDLQSRASKRYIDDLVLLDNSNPDSVEFSSDSSGDSQTTQSESTSVDEPIDDQESPVVDEPADDPTPPVVDEPADDPAPPIVDEPADDPAPPVVDEPADDPAPPVVDEPVDDPAPPVVDEPTDDPQPPVVDESDWYNKKMAKLNAKIHKMKLRILANHVKKLRRIQQIRNKRDLILENRLKDINRNYQKVISKLNNTKKEALAEKVLERRMRNIERFEKRRERIIRKVASLKEKREKAIKIRLEKKKSRIMKAKLKRLNSSIKSKKDRFDVLKKRYVHVKKVEQQRVKNIKALEKMRKKFARGKK